MTQDHEISHRTVLIIIIEGKAECFNVAEEKIQFSAAKNEINDACKTLNITFQ
jgi:hypothetical protein